MAGKRIMREVEAIAAEITPHFDLGRSKNNHLCLTIHHAGRSRDVHFSSTPSDHRAILNFKSKLRRTYNELVQGR